MKFTKLKEEFSTLWIFYLDIFFSGIVTAIAAPVMILYFQDIGLSFLGISTIIAVPMLATLLFEIPTGAIADIYGRKFSVLLGMFLEAILLLLIPLFRGAAVLLVIFFMSRIAGTFISGANEAWITDLLKHKKKSHLLQTYYVRLITVVGTGAAIGGVISSLVVATFGLPSVWIIAGIAEAFIAFMLLIFAKEHFVKRKAKIVQELRKSLTYGKEGIQYILKHPVLLYFFAETVIWSFAGIWGIAMQPFFRNLGLEAYNFGILFSIVGVIAIIAPFGSKYLIKFFKKEKTVMMISQVLQAGVFAMLAAVSNLYVALFIYLLSHPFGIATGPIARKFKQQFIPSAKRATINSVFTAISVPGAIVGLLIGGKLLDLFGPRFSLFIVIIAAMSSILLYAKMKPENAKIEI